MSSYNQHDFERIEAYLQGRMPPSAKAEFEQDMASDAALKKEVDLHRGMAAALHDPQEEAFRNTLSEIERELGTTDKMLVPDAIPGHQPAMRMRRIVALRSWSVAAAAMLVLAVGITVLWPGKLDSTPSADRLVQNNIGRYPAPAATRGPAEDARLALQEAYTAYDNGDYATALEGFSAQPEPMQQHPDVLFFRSMSQLHLDQGGEAAAGFEALLKQGENQWTADAEWHLVLATIQQGAYGAALALCRRISEQGGAFAGPANTLLPDLERLMDQADADALDRPERPRP